jgi:hypothetical protein
MMDDLNGRGEALFSMISKSQTKILTITSKPIQRPGSKNRVDDLATIIPICKK